MAKNDEELVEVAAKIEIILIHSWLGIFDLKKFPSILVVNCRGATLLEISKFYKSISISSMNYQKHQIFFAMMSLCSINMLIHKNSK